MKYCRFSVQCQFMMMFLRNKVVDLFIFQMHFKLCKKYIHTAHWRHWVIETYWEWALRSSLSFPTCFPGGSNGNESACDAGDPGSTPVLGRSPGEGIGNPLQHSCVENSLGRKAWQVTVHGIAMSWTWLSNQLWLFFLNTISVPGSS